MNVKHRMMPLLTTGMMLALLTMPAGASAASGSSLTLKAADGNTLAGHTFNAYLIGEYTDVETKGNTVTGFSVEGTTATNQWIQKAFDTLNGNDTATDDITIPIGRDAAGTVASLTKDGDEARLRAIAGQLNATAKQGTAVAVNKTTNGGQLTITLPADGLYLITDTNGMPLIAGTTFGGKTLNGQTAGIVYVKSRTNPIDKTILRADGTEADTDAVTVGETYTFHAETAIPNGLNGGAVGFTLTDRADNMTIVNGSLTAWLMKETNGEWVKDTSKDVTSLLTAAYQNNGMTVNADRLLADHSNERLLIEYRATITKADRSVTPGNTITTTTVFQTGPDPEDTASVDEHDTVSLKTGALRIHKTANDNQTLKLKNAGFKIARLSDSDTETWLTCTSGVWKDAASKDAATMFTTDDNGTTLISGLGAGRYLIDEVQAPSGYVDSDLAYPSFVMTVAQDGTVTVEGKDNPGLTGQNANETDGTGSVTVKNISSLTELPATGGILWLGVETFAGVTLVGCAALLTHRSIRLRHGLKTGR